MQPLIHHSSKIRKQDFYENYDLDQLHQIEASLKNELAVDQGNKDNTGLYNAYSSSIDEDFNYDKKKYEMVVKAIELKQKYQGSEQGSQQEGGQQKR